jgi:TPP-dependent pyruvate/acetoin dehydrogenase alpha subunit
MAVREAEPVETLQQVAGLDREDLLGMYRNMSPVRWRARPILTSRGRSRVVLHGARQRGGGRCRDGDGASDVGTPLQRDMGVHITRGIEPWRIFAQYMGREDGPTRGRDGNVHMGDSRLGLPMVSHLPAMLPVGVGCSR